MRWFKHLSGSLNNSLIFEAIEKHGHESYVVFFGILELMADEFDIHNPGKNRFSIKKVTKNCQISVRKLRKICEFFDKKAKENKEKNISFECEFEGKYIHVTCVRLAELCDEWTRKQLNKLRSKSGVAPDLLPAQEVELEVEVDKDIKTPLRDSSESTPKENGKFYISKKGRKLQGAVLEKYENFWNVFHAGHIKRGKAEAADAFLKAINLEKYERILHGAGCEAEARKLLRDDQTPIYAQGWLSARRWEDYEKAEDTSPADKQKRSEWQKHKEKVGLK